MTKLSDIMKPPSDTLLFYLKIFGLAPSSSCLQIVTLKFFDFGPCNISPYILSLIYLLYDPEIIYLIIHYKRASKKLPIRFLQNDI